MKNLEANGYFRHLNSTLFRSQIEIHFDNSNSSIPICDFIFLSLTNTGMARRESVKPFSVFRTSLSRLFSQFRRSWWMTKDVSSCMDSTFCSILHWSLGCLKLIQGKNTIWCCCCFFTYFFEHSFLFSKNLFQNYSLNQPIHDSEHSDR